MATAKSKVHLHAYFDKDGKFSSWTFLTWKQDDKNIGEYGFHVFVKTVEVETEVPPMEDITKGAVGVVQAAIKQKVADHQLWMTQMALLKNNLLALPAPDVLDAA